MSARMGRLLTVSIPAVLGVAHAQGPSVQRSACPCGGKKACKCNSKSNDDRVLGSAAIAGLIEGQLTEVGPDTLLPLQRLAGNSLVGQLIGERSIASVQRQSGSDIADPPVEGFIESCTDKVLDPNDPTQHGTLCITEDGFLCEVKPGGVECRRAGPVSGDGGGGPGAGGGASSVLSMGSSGPAVEALQTALNDANTPIAEDGNFTDETRGAVITFQAQADLKPDGLAGPKTKEALGLPPGGGLLSLGSSGPEVEELQRALNGTDQPIAVDGEFGDETRGAVITFQAQNALDPDGIVGPKTKQSLGLPES